MRAAHIALFLIASRGDAALRRSVIGLAGSTVLGTGLLLAAALAGGGRVALWALALASTWPARTSSAPTAGSSCPGTSPSATARSCIIALGESIAEIGVPRT